MKAFQCLLLFTLAVYSNAFGQTRVKTNHSKIKATKNPGIVGTWRLVEFAEWDFATSKWTYSYGKNPNGYFTYTKSGIVNLNISSESASKISRDSAKLRRVNLLNWVDSNSVGYFGTYSVNVTKSIITHHVKGGGLPWYIDTNQERPFILKGDTLIIGDNKTWKRVLVRVD